MWTGEPTAAICTIGSSSISWHGRHSASNGCQPTKKCREVLYTTIPTPQIHLGSNRSTSTSRRYQSALSVDVPAKPQGFLIRSEATLTKGKDYPDNLASRGGESDSIQSKQPQTAGHKNCRGCNQYLWARSRLSCTVAGWPYRRGVCYRLASTGTSLRRLRLSSADVEGRR